MHERKAEREQLQIVETGELLKLAAASRLQGEGRTYTVYIVQYTHLYFNVSLTIVRFNSIVGKI